MVDTKKYSAIDLFAGAGGLSLGLTKNNINIFLANEIETDFAKTYALNHRNTKMRFSQKPRKI